METLLTTTIFSLSPGEVTTLAIDRDGQRLHVLDADGLDLWVTRDRDSVDYWLRCGGNLPLSPGEELVLSVQPKAARPVRVALIAEARRPAGASMAHLLSRLVRRLGRGTQWSPKDDVVAAA